MTPDEIAVVRGELEAFAAEVFEPFARKDQHRWGQVYLRGLLTDGQRKSVEPMAKHPETFTNRVLHGNDRLRRIPARFAVRRSTPPMPAPKKTVM